MTKTVIFTVPSTVRGVHHSIGSVAALADPTAAVYVNTDRARELSEDEAAEFAAKRAAALAAALARTPLTRGDLDSLSELLAAIPDLELGTAASLDVGTGADQIVQLDGTAKLPAVDGSQLTNLAAGAPGGSTKQLQFNNAGAFSGATQLEYDSTTGRLIGPGIAWTSRTVEESFWLSIAYGNGLFVAVAPSGTNQVTTSPDGITWTSRTAAEANQWITITYGNGLFVAVAQNGTNRVMTSPDGITWTARSAAEANSWVGVTYGNGLFVAVANSGTNRVMTSPDGITWTARSAAEANSWARVTYGNGLFVAVADSGTNRVMTSPDGITWTARTAAEANTWAGVTYGGGLFVAVAFDGTNRVMTSPDGITWTARAAAGANTWAGVTYGDGLFVAVAINLSNRVMTSGVKREHNLYAKPVRSAFVADPSGGATQDAESRTAINAILDILVAHGMMQGA